MHNIEAEQDSSAFLRPYNISQLLRIMYIMLNYIHSYVMLRYYLINTNLNCMLSNCISTP